MIKILTTEDIESLRKQAVEKIALTSSHGIESPYEDLLKRILIKGSPKTDRTGTGTVSIFGYQMRFDLSKGFPLITTKKIHMKSVIYELLWFLKGDTNIKYLNDNGVRIWNEWADEKGDLGPVYGKQWRNWSYIENVGNIPREFSIDQIAESIKTIKKNPDSRRIIVCAWNVPDIPKMALAPCHCLFQFYVADGKLSCQLYQRSADVFLGVPFNIASYALLTMMVAQVCNLELGDFVITFGDVHLYANHFEQAVLQLSRQPYSSPTMYLANRKQGIDEFEFDDFQLVNYKSHPHIKASVAV